MNIVIILGSTRPNYRLGDRVAKWVMNEATNFIGINFKLLDLREYNLPFFYEDEGPRGNENRNIPDNIKHWLKDMSEADAYIFLVAEYNTAPNASLKNALDLLGHEGERKPAALIGYSDGSNGGMYAPFQLRPILNELEIIAIPGEQTILNADKIINEEGIPTSNESENLSRRFDRLLNNLLWFAKALKNARES